MVYSFQVITEEQEFHNIEREWNSLLLKSSTPNIFLRWEWLYNWWRVFNTKTRHLHIICLYKDKQLEAIGPFYIEKKQYSFNYTSSILFFLGTQESWEGDVVSDYLDVFSKQNFDTASDQIYEYILSDKKIDSISLKKIRTDSNLIHTLNKKKYKYRHLVEISRKYHDPFILLPNSWEKYLGSLSGSMRYKLNSQRRKASKEYKIELKRVSRGNEVLQYFDILVNLHTERWIKKNKNGAFSNAKFLGFHKLILPQLIKKNLVDFWVLCLNNEIVACLYNLTYQGKIYFYQSGIDHDATKFTIGYLAHGYCIENAIKRGFKEYAFLPDLNENSYKDRFCYFSREVADVLVVQNKYIQLLVILRKLAKKTYSAICRVNDA